MKTQNKKYSLSVDHIKKKQFDKDMADINKFLVGANNPVKQFDGAFYSLSSSLENTGLYFDDNAMDVFDIRQGRQGIVILPNLNSVCIIKMRPAKSKDFRGELKFVPKGAFLLEDCLNNNDTNYETFKFAVKQNIGVMNSYRDSPWSFENHVEMMKSCWTLLSKCDFHDSHLVEWVSVYAQTVLQVLLEEHFTWKIKVQRPNWKISISYPFDRNNIKEVFRLRDISDGEQRRKALRNLISAHKRKIHDTERLTDVMRYLRGKESFSAFGENYQIIPSMEDIIELNMQRACEISR